MSQTAQVPAQSFNAIFTTDPEVQQKSDDRWRLAWKVAHYASLAFFIISSAAAFACTSLFMPSQLFGVTLALFTFGLHYATKVANYFYDNSQFYANNLRSDHKVIEQLNNIKDVNECINNLGIQPSPKLSTTELKRGLAYYQVCRNEAVSFLKKGQSLSKKIKANICSLENIDWNDKDKVATCKTVKNMKFQKRVHKLQSALAKLQSSYYLKLIESPLENRSFYQFNPLLFDQAKYPKISKAFLIQSHGKKFTVGQILNKDTASLAREIFELSRCKWFGIF